MSRTLPIGFLVSGEGTTLDAIAERIEAGTLPARIVIVLCDREGAPAIERARRRGLATAVLPSRGANREEWGAELTRRLEAAGADLVVLAGFLAVLPPGWVDRWSGRAINLHPSLLPRHGGRGMYGPKVHRAVLAAGDRETGATVHLVTRDVDRGPTISQVQIAVRPGETEDSLRARLHPVEVELLAQTILRFADGSIPLPHTPASR